MKIVIASHNPGKIKDFKEILEPLNYKVQGVEELGVDVSKVIEDGNSFEENALIKAKYVYDILKIPVLSDDSGLNIKAFPNLLGIHSARYLEGQSYTVKNQSILKMLNKKEDRSASFVSSLVYYDGKPNFFTGVIHGEIADEIKGDGGFGYDPIFIPYKHSQSFAEMGTIEKGKISHRAIALKKFLDFLEDKSL